MGQRVRFDVSGYILFVLMILLLPLKWVGAAMTAAVIHELCHIAMIRFLEGDILHTRIGVSGTSITLMPMTPKKELLCSAAGPAGSLLTAALYSLIPRIAVCAGVQAIFNLLPIYPLDGARILRCAAEIWIPEKAEKIAAGVERAMLFVIFGGTAAMSIVFHMGISPVLLGTTVILRAFQRKIPCKEARIGVQ